MYIKRSKMTLKNDFSNALRRVETFLRTSMSEERLSSLAMMAIHRDIDINIDAIIDTFARVHPRRMTFTNILER